MGEEVTVRRAPGDNSNDDNTARCFTFLIDPQVVVFSLSLLPSFHFGD